jgi:hypothetical protein
MEQGFANTFRKSIHPVFFKHFRDVHRPRKQESVIVAGKVRRSGAKEEKLVQAFKVSMAMRSCSGLSL